MCPRIPFYIYLWSGRLHFVKKDFGSGSGSAWIRINLSCWIRIRIRIQIADLDPDPGGQKLPTKNRKKSRIFIFLSTGCSLLRAEGFSCSLGVLYGGLGISKLQFLIKKIGITFPAINFFQFQVIKPWIRIRDPDLESGSGIRIRNQKNAGSGSVSGSALNQCGSETLQKSQNHCTLMHRAQLTFSDTSILTQLSLFKNFHKENSSKF